MFVLLHNIIPMYIKYETYELVIFSNSNKTLLKEIDILIFIMYRIHVYSIINLLTNNIFFVCSFICYYLK
jgi:hypothetical protein